MDYPSIEQLRELPLQLDMEIPGDWEDRNGHVNVQFYLALYELGGWVVLEEIGINEEWFSQHQVSQFDLEHHLSYRAELRVGDRVSAYSRVLGRSEKRFHGMYFIVNETRQLLAATLEYVTAGVDMKTRRTAPFRDDLASGLDWMIEKHKGLSWDAPVCGSMNP